MIYFHTHILKAEPAVLINVMNFIFRIGYIYLIKRIGLSTKSLVANKIMNTLFVITFINTGFIFLLSNANLKYAPGFISWTSIDNLYPDLDHMWYQKVGRPIVFTMALNSVFPWIELAVFGGIKLLKQLLDRKKCLCLKP